MINGILCAKMGISPYFLGVFAPDTIYYIT